MEVRLAASFQNPHDPALVPLIERASGAISACVHCGFCNATCPSYQVFGDELDGPRGRIYLVKQVLEGAPIDTQLATHLDRCLTCLNCETTCPSGVRYGDLVEFGRAAIEHRSDGPSPVLRSRRRRLQRWLLRRTLPELDRLRWPLRGAYRIATALARRLPEPWARQLPFPQMRAAPLDRPARAPLPQPVTATPSTRIQLLEGCVHEIIDPRIALAFERIIAVCQPDARIERVRGCCGAIDLHLGDADAAARRVYKLQMQARSADATCPDEAPVTLVQMASGCLSHLRRFTEHDHPTPDALHGRIHDPSELLTPEAIRAAGIDAHGEAIAWHPPCSLQHGLHLDQRVRALLEAAGFDLLPVAETHLCCGSAGTYSMLEPQTARSLRDRKLFHLEAHAPTRIVTANIGCQAHLASASKVPVEHWAVALSRHLPSCEDR